MSSFLPGGFPIIDPVTRLGPPPSPEMEEAYKNVAEQLKDMAARCGLKVERVIPVHNGVTYPQYATLQFVRKDQT